MATDQNPQEFYREVDKYRHQRGCWGVISFVIIALLVVGAAYWLARRFGLL